MTISKEQLVLLLISAAYPEQLSPVQLQKSVFLAQKAVEEAGWDSLLTSKYEFDPYDYGPFCKQIYVDLKLLEQQGLSQIGRGKTNYKTYSSTAQGKRLIEVETVGLPDGFKTYVTQLISWVKQQSFASLVASVYKKYPEMKVNSVFRG